MFTNDALVRNKHILQYINMLHKIQIFTSDFFEYSIKQKAPTIVRLLMLINDVFLCLILEHQCCSSLECVGTVTIAHS